MDARAVIARYRRSAIVCGRIGPRAERGARCSGTTCRPRCTGATKRPSRTSGGGRDRRPVVKCWLKQLLKGSDGVELVATRLLSFASSGVSPPELEWRRFFCFSCGHCGHTGGGQTVDRRSGWTRPPIGGCRWFVSFWGRLGDRELTDRHCNQRPGLFSVSVQITRGLGVWNRGLPRSEVDRTVPALRSPGSTRNSAPSSLCPAWWGHLVALEACPGKR